MAKAKPNGTAIEINNLKMTLSEYKALMARIRTGNQKSAYEAGYTSAVEGDYEDGTIKFLIDAEEESEAVKKQVDDLNALIGGFTGDDPSVQFTARGTRLRTKSYHLDSSSQLSKLKAMTTKSALNVNYDRNKKQVTVMTEANAKSLISRVAGVIGDGHRIEDNNLALKKLLYAEDVNDPEYDDEHKRLQNLAKIQPDHPLAMRYASMVQKINNRDDKARLRKAIQTPGTPEFDDAVELGLNRRVARENAQLAWAKKNKKLPIAKAMMRSIKRRRRGATAGGRLLNKAIGYARATAIGAVVSVIGTAVVSMVKFLSELPAIASNVHKLASKGVQYNVSEAILAQYKDFAHRLTGDENGIELFGGFMGNIHGALASVVNNDIEGAIGPVAAMSSKAGGWTIRAMTKYLNGDSSGLLETMHALTSEAAHLTFLGESGTLGGLTQTEAASRNIRDIQASAVGGEQAAQVFNWLMTKFNALEEPLQRRIKSATIGGGDFVKLMMEEVYGTKFNGYKVAGSVAVVQSKNVGDQLRALGADYKATKDGILDKILANLEPVVGVLRQILRSVLGIVGKVTGDETALYEYYAETRNRNLPLIEVNKSVRDFTEAEVTRLRTELGFTDEVTRKDAIEAYERGQKPANGPGSTASWDKLSEWRSKEAVLEYATRNADKFANDTDYSLGKKDVRGISTAAYATTAEESVAKGNQRRTDAVAALITEYGASPTGNARLGQDYVGALRLADEAVAWLGDSTGYARDVKLLRRYSDTYAKARSGFQPDGYFEPLTGKYYKDPVEHKRDVESLGSMLDDVAAISYDSTKPLETVLFEHRAASASLPRNVGNKQELITAVTQKLFNTYGDDIGTEFSSRGVARIEVAITRDQNNMVIALQDSDKKTVKTIPDVIDIAVRDALVHGPVELVVDDVLRAYSITR